MFAILALMASDFTRHLLKQLWSARSRPVMADRHLRSCSLPTRIDSGTDLCDHVHMRSTATADPSAALDTAARWLKLKPHSRPSFKLRGMGLAAERAVRGAPADGGAAAEMLAMPSRGAGALDVPVAVVVPTTTGNECGR